VARRLLIGLDFTFGLVLISSAHRLPREAYMISLYERRLRQRSVYDKEASTTRSIYAKEDRP
jgi:hypothetical protein